MPTKFRDLTYDEIKLRNRADRLRRLVNLNSPSVIIAREVGLILRGLRDVAPDQVSVALAALDSNNGENSNDQAKEPEEE